MTRAIVDTGPLVAFLNTRDARHQWALETFDSFRMPLATCEAVLTEAWFVVRQSKANPNSVLALLSRGIITLDFRLSSELEAVRKLMTKYATVPMALTGRYALDLRSITKGRGFFKQSVSHYDELPHPESMKLVQEYASARASHEEH